MAPDEAPDAITWSWLGGRDRLAASAPAAAAVVGLADVAAAGVPVDVAWLSPPGIDAELDMAAGGCPDEGRACCGGPEVLIAAEEAAVQTAEGYATMDALERIRDGVGRVTGEALAVVNAMAAGCFNFLGLPTFFPLSTEGFWLTPALAPDEVAFWPVRVGAWPALRLISLAEVSWRFALVLDSVSDVVDALFLVTLDCGGG